MSGNIVKSKKSKRSSKISPECANSKNGNNVVVENDEMIMLPSSKDGGCEVE